MSLTLILVGLSFLISGILQAKALILIKNTDSVTKLKESPIYDQLRKLKKFASGLVVLGLLIFILSLIMGWDYQLNF